MSDIKNFSWTDELLREFFYSAHKFFAKGHGFSSALTEFKKSKEKDIPKDNWEVISYIGWHNLKKDTIFKKRGNLFYPDGIDDHAGYHEFYLKEYLTDIKIHSVKRLSDGEVFTIGDKVLWLPNDITTITEFRLINGELAIYGEGFGIPLENISKVKPKVPLFTTSDLHTVYEYDTYPVYKVDKNFQLLHFSACDCMNYKDSTYFYNYDKALEYINLNKPCLSIKDVEELFEKRDFIGTDYLKRLLIERVKQIQNP